MKKSLLITTIISLFMIAMPLFSQVKPKSQSILIDTYLIHNIKDGKQQFGGEKHIVWLICPKDRSILITNLMEDTWLLEYNNVNAGKNGVVFYECSKGGVVIGVQPAKVAGKHSILFMIPSENISQIYDYRTFKEYTSKNK